MLLSVANCSVDAADNDKTTPLIMASIQGNLNICELLVGRPLMNMHAAASHSQTSCYMGEAVGCRSPVVLKWTNGTSMI